MADERHCHEHHEDCDCEDIIILQDEDGNDHEFSIVDVLELDDNKYAILLPTDEEMDEAVILKIDVDENGDEILFEIEDDEEWEAVARAWEKLLEEEE
ncbi:DUF1292 domain-containing protein [Zhaonella formicivorans]|uniref:DUF1292 domain-containing protein n=1 Tax=Zhaonella formicivorans TaxID=2528593 RepID=UPI0010E140DD|nr:DUF1292 domain-containing protein [Zhaonella formicivorans]